MFHISFKLPEAKNCNTIFWRHYLSSINFQLTALRVQPNFPLSVLFYVFLLVYIPTEYSTNKIFSISFLSTKILYFLKQKSRIIDCKDVLSLRTSISSNKNPEQLPFSSFSFKLIFILKFHSIQRYPSGRIFFHGNCLGSVHSVWDEEKIEKVKFNINSQKRLN